MLDDFPRQEVALHERAERSPDTILLRRHDRRVWDRQAERMAEQRGDGEPVGDAADHRRFHRRAREAEPEAMVVHFEDSGDDEQHAGGDEQRRRQPLHAIEPRLTLGLVLHGGGLENGRRPGDEATGRPGDTLSRRLGAHLGVTCTFAKLIIAVLAPAGTSTYSTTGRPLISRTFTSTVRVADSKCRSSPVTRGRRLNRSRITWSTASMNSMPS